jgi:hypothetical protein
MGAVAAGRRTQSAFATYLASTNPSELRMVTGAYNPSVVGADIGYLPPPLTRAYSGCIDIRVHAL